MQITFLPRHILIAWGKDLQILEIDDKKCNQATLFSFQKDMKIAKNWIKKWFFAEQIPTAIQALPTHPRTG